MNIPICERSLVVGIAMMLLTFIVFSSTVSAECYTNARGRYVCNNGQVAGGYNAKTGNAWKSQKNQNGVATTQTSAGGEAKTKNGRGVYQSPNGKNCYKTANNYGCN
jgi:hypothetical protein